MPTQRCPPGLAAPVAAAYPHLKSQHQSHLIQERTRPARALPSCKLTRAASGPPGAPPGSMDIPRLHTGSVSCCPLPRPTQETWEGEQIPLQCPAASHIALWPRQAGCLEGCSEGCCSAQPCPPGASGTAGAIPTSHSSEGMSCQRGCRELGPVPSDAGDSLSGPRKRNARCRGSSSSSSIFMYL